MREKTEILPRRAFSVQEAASLGVGRTRLAAMVTAGELRRLMAGVYAPVDADVSLYPELEILAAKGSEGVVALESALRIHDFTTALPSTVYWRSRRARKRRAWISHALSCEFLARHMTLPSNGMRLQTV